MRKTRVLSLGAGVQSSALLLMADRGDIAPINFAVFSDTQQELPETYVWLEKLIKAVKVKVIKTTKGDLLKDGAFIIPAYLKTPKEADPQIDFTDPNPSTKYKRGKGKRICTVDYKISPVRRAVREELGYKKGQHIKGKEFVTMVIGFSTDEATRMKDADPEDWTENQYPLCMEKNMSREDCKKYVFGIMGEEPPRSSCYFCPLHDDYEWLRIKENHPEYFEKACQLDEEARRTKGFNGLMKSEVFLHDSLVPLREAKFDPAKGKNRVRKMCGGNCKT